VGGYCHFRRGLNPPRRVKSVSLSIFNKEEVEKVRRMGNEENAKIWLGLCDKPKFETKNDDEIKQHLIQKYEAKRWFVSPEELAEQKRLLESLSDKVNMSARRSSISGISIQSHKSNQSAPSNINQGNASNDLVYDFIELPKNLVVSAPKPQTSQNNSLILGLEDLFENINFDRSRELNRDGTSTIQNLLPDLNIAKSRPIQPVHEPIQEHTPIQPNLTIKDDLPQANLLPDGRPVMSKHEELPDYSALEDVFRDDNPNEGLHNKPTHHKGSHNHMEGFTNSAGSFSRANIFHPPINQKWNPFL